MFRLITALTAALLCSGHVHMALAQTTQQPQTNAQDLTPLQKEELQIFPRMDYRYLPIRGPNYGDSMYKRGDYLITPTPVDEVMQRFRQVMPQLQWTQSEHSLWLHDLEEVDKALFGVLALVRHMRLDDATAHQYRWDGLISSNRSTYTPYKRGAAQGPVASADVRIQTFVTTLKQQMEGVANSSFSNIYVVMDVQGVFDSPAPLTFVWFTRHIPPLQHRPQRSEWSWTECMETHGDRRCFFFPHRIEYEGEPEPIAYTRAQQEQILQYAAQVDRVVKDLPKWPSAQMQKIFIGALHCLRDRRYRPLYPAEAAKAAEQPAGVPDKPACADIQP
ncbi:MAG: hypothetical protein Q4G70_06195 [Pseudomonadota bacterium]|nr:hypothetical protein [Pseudomonadota bacterium]